MITNAQFRTLRRDYKRQFEWYFKSVELSAGVEEPTFGNNLSRLVEPPAHFDKQVQSYEKERERERPPACLLLLLLLLLLLPLLLLLLLRCCCRCC